MFKNKVDLCPCMVHVFNDKRWTAAIILVWSAVVLVVFFSMGVLHSSFFRFGPSENLRFLSIPIDTFEKWIPLAIYCAVDTLVRSFAHDSVVPWLTHTVADPKTRELPYSKAMCLGIMESYFSYVHFSHVFKFFLSLTQFDFILISALADLSMKIFSYSSYMTQKTEPNQTEDISALIEAKTPS